MDKLIILIMIQKKLMTILLAVVLFSQILPHRMMIYALEKEEAFDTLTDEEDDQLQLAIEKIKGK